MKKYVCTICGYIYDEAAGSPDQGIAADTKWEDLPETWVCPICTAPKSMFNEVKEEVKEEAEEKLIDAIKKGRENAPDQCYDSDAEATEMEE